MTIIVLLILAGVSVSMLTGQNGILTNAAKAKESTDSASDLEYLQLKATECLMDYYQGNDSVGEDGLRVENQVKLDVMYDGKVLPVDFRLDILVEDKVIVELKSVAEISANPRSRSAVLRIAERVK